MKNSCHNQPYDPKNGRRNRRNTNITSQPFFLNVYKFVYPRDSDNTSIIQRLYPIAPAENEAGGFLRCVFYSSSSTNPSDAWPNTWDKVQDANSISFTPNSTVTSDNVQDAIGEVATQLSTKLTTPTGTQGQYLGFTADNVVGAVDAPKSGLTQEQADARYLRLTGGLINQEFSLSYGPQRIVVDGSGVSIGTDDSESTPGEIRMSRGYVDIYCSDEITFNSQGTFLSISPEYEGEPSITFTNSGAIRNLSSPTTDTDAANKAYVDSKTPTHQTIILTSSAWSSNSQTVTVSGVTADELDQLITPTPAIASQSAYYEARIMCTNQGTNSLTFTCQTVPTSNLTVYVVIQPLG